MHRRFRQIGNLRDFAQRETVLRCRDDFDNLEITLDRSGVMRFQVGLPGFVLLPLNAPRGPFSQVEHSKGQPNLTKPSMIALIIVNRDIIPLIETIIGKVETA